MAGNNGAPRDPGRKEPKDGQDRREQRNKRLGQIGWAVLIIAILLGTVYLFYANQRAADTLQYSAVVEQFEKENVRAFQVTGTKLTMELYEPYGGQQALTYDLYDVQMFREDLGNRRIRSMQTKAACREAVAELENGIAERYRQSWSELAGAEPELFLRACSAGMKAQ